MAARDHIEVSELRIVRAGPGLRALEYKQDNREAKPPEPPDSLLSFLLEHTLLKSYDELEARCAGEMEGLSLLKPESVIDEAARVPKFARDEEAAEANASTKLKSIRTSLGRRGVDLESVRIAFATAGVTMEAYAKAIEVINSHPQTFDFEALEVAATTVNEANLQMGLDMSMVLRAFEKTPYTFKDYVGALRNYESALGCTAAREDFAELEAMWNRLGDALRVARGRDNEAPPA